MRDFVATFHTHLSALMTSKALQKAGYANRMAPVPRQLSSSCGTCVFYTAPDLCRNCLDDDTERVYEHTDDTYVLLLDLEDC